VTPGGADQLYEHSQGPTGANADVTGRGERNQGHEDQPANLLNILMIYQLDMRIMHKEVHIFG